jgi:hypothetical protein
MARPVSLASERLPHANGFNLDPRDFLCRHRFTEQIALQFIARAITMEPILLGSFHALGHYRQPSALPKAMIAVAIARSAGLCARSRTKERSILMVSTGNFYAGGHILSPAHNSWRAIGAAGVHDSLPPGFSPQDERTALTQGESVALRPGPAHHYFSTQRNGYPPDRTPPSRAGRHRLTVARPQPAIRGSRFFAPFALALKPTILASNQL